MKRLKKNFLDGLVDMGRAGFDILARDLFGREYKRYGGNAVDICRQIIEDRWNGTYFEGGETLFRNQFWIRDFSFFVREMIELGFKDKVRKNVAWALKIYGANGAIGTTILGGRTVVDFWHYSADSLPFLLFSLRESESLPLAVTYRDFLNQEIKKYFQKVFDPSTSLVREKSFSTPKDVVMRKQTCVANAFMIFTQKLLRESFPTLDNPFFNIDLSTPFMVAFWNSRGKFFRNDLEVDGDVVSADANILPYWLGVVEEESMLRGSIAAIKREKLDEPFPLRFHSFFDHLWMRTHWGARILTPNYQGNSIWAFFAPFYIDYESRFYPNDAKNHLRKWLSLIEKYRTLVEVFEPDGSTPLKGRFGHKAETGLLWAAAIPPLVKKISPGLSKRF